MVDNIETDSRKAKPVSMESRPKNIVLCSDGTGNRGGVGYDTNVWRIFNYIDLKSHITNSANPAQVAFYEDGVGTEKWKMLKLLGGAFGLGVNRNIRDMYYFLVNNYEPGDKIYLFGFSRGAFTVRKLAGMICACGILRRDDIHSPTLLKDRVCEAFKIYKRVHKSRGYKEADIFRSRNSHPDSRDVEFIGVWDTVGARGIPVIKTKFESYDLSEHVMHGYHALAIDDERTTFHPHMWNEKDSTRPDGSNLEQVWFAGVHSNVGGGYPKQGMAHESLYWMMTQAEKHGLHFESGALAEVRKAANVDDMLYDSRAGFGAYYRYSPRDIDAICSKNCLGPAKIHLSVIKRINKATRNYAPGNFPKDFDLVVTDPTDIPDGHTLSGIHGRIATHRPTYEHLLNEGNRFISRLRRFHGYLVAITVAILVSPWLLKRSGFQCEEGSEFVGAAVDTAVNAAGAPNAVVGWFAPLGCYFEMHPGRLALAIFLLVGILLIPKIIRYYLMDPKFYEFWSRVRPLF